MILDYPLEFALTLWLPFDGTLGALVAVASSTIDHLLNDSACWLAEAQPDGSQHRFEPEEMACLWETIHLAKLRVQAFWLVHQKHAPAYAAAIELMRPHFPQLNFSSSSPSKPRATTTRKPKSADAGEGMFALWGASLR